jgi:hypothetical protein
MEPELHERELPEVIIPPQAPMSAVVTQLLMFDGLGEAA